MFFGEEEQDIIAELLFDKVSALSGACSALSDRILADPSELTSGYLGQASEFVAKELVKILFQLEELNKILRAILPDDSFI